MRIRFNRSDLQTTVFQKSMVRLLNELELFFLHSPFLDRDDLLDLMRFLTVMAEEPDVPDEVFFVTYQMRWLTENRMRSEKLVSKDGYRGACFYRRVEWYPDMLVVSVLYYCEDKWPFYHMPEHPELIDRRIILRQCKKNLEVQTVFNN